MKKTHSFARINFGKKSLYIAIAAMVAGFAYAEELPIITDDFTFEQDAVVGGILLEPENSNKDITISGGSSLTISTPSEKEYAIYMLPKWGGRTMVS